MKNYRNEQAERNDGCGKFLLGSKITEAKLSQIVPIYQSAFAGPPWYEKSKCADPQSPKRCETGFSSLNIEEVCRKCSQKTTQEAYPADELIKRFKDLNSKKQICWYTEQSTNGELVLASYAWTGTPRQIAKEKYPGNEKMSGWLVKYFGKAEEIIWYDEVFADLGRRPEGNLNNWKQAVEGIMKRLGINTVAFRTINQGLIRATVRDFPNAQIFAPEEIPDWRYFVIIKA